MTPGARRVLEDLATDERCDLIQEGRSVYCGTRPTTPRVVNELLGVFAIQILYRDGFKTPITNYGISDIGRSLFRRPELENELLTWMLKRPRRPFTVINDRIKPVSTLLKERG